MVFWSAIVIILTSWLGGIAEAQAQSRGGSVYTFDGRRLTSDMVRDELERRMALEPRNEASLWNVGYDFFRNFPPNQDTARLIKEGFLRARSNTPDQRATLHKAAVFWEKIHDHGLTNVPVGLDNSSRQKIYYGDTRKASTLSLRQRGSQHQKFPNYSWPGRYINKRPPYQGRPDNPYPGKYYPGVYPP